MCGSSAFATSSFEDRSGEVERLDDATRSTCTSLTKVGGVRGEKLAAVVAGECCNAGHGLEDMELEADAFGVDRGTDVAAVA